MCVNDPKSKDFCWDCLNPWKIPGREQCGNLTCTAKKDSNFLLKNCAVKTILGVPNVPIYRSCPKCKAITEHFDDKCPTMRCKTKGCWDAKFWFCHICLLTSSNHRSATCKVAPRQVLAD